MIRIRSSSSLLFIHTYNFHKSKIIIIIEFEENWKNKKFVEILLTKKEERKEK